MEVFRDKKHQKNIKQFVCEDCHFSCCKKGDWNRHISTQKHTSEYAVKNVKPIVNKTKQYACYCGTILKSRTTIWRHKNNCKQQPKNIDTFENTEHTENISSDLIIKLLSQNNDLHANRTK